MEHKEYLGITAEQAQELKNAFENLNGDKFTAFDAMTPANCEWINRDIDTAIRAASFRPEKFFKLWIIHHFRFPGKVFFYSHRFLPELTKKLMKYSGLKCYRKKPHFVTLDMIYNTISSIMDKNHIDENIIDKTVMESAAGCYRDSQPRTSEAAK